MITVSRLLGYAASLAHLYLESFTHSSLQIISSSVSLDDQFGWAASSRKRLCASKCLPFKNDGGHCVLGDLQCSINVLVPFPRSVPRHNPVLELYGQFLRTHGLVFSLTCETLYRQAFPNHVQSIEFTTGGLQSSWRNISRMINGNRTHLSSISSLIAKGLNAYVNKVLIFIFIKMVKMLNLFLLCHYKVLGVD